MFLTSFDFVEFFFFHQSELVKTIVFCTTVQFCLTDKVSTKTEHNMEFLQGTHTLFAAEGIINISWLHGFRNLIR